MNLFQKIGIGLCLVCNITAYAEETQCLAESSWLKSMKKTWCCGDWELWVPINTWHNRWTYSHKKAKSYNERPWGAGIGKYRYDEKGNRYSLAFMTFQDSHNKPEPTFGYSWQKVWRQGKTFRPTLGLMGGITFRDDYHWIPLPAILPIAGIDIGPFSLENTYVPGLGGNNGNVLFTWVRWRF